MYGVSAPQLLSSLTLFLIPSCLSTPGLFNFSQTDAFIELDTQPFSCSKEIQRLFSLTFDVYVTTNYSVLFTGISGSLLSTNSTDLSPDSAALLGNQGDPLAFFIYAERPYFRLVIIRLTDYRVRFYLHHAFGYFDRRWKDWHRVEVTLVRSGSTRTEISFKVDQKINRGILRKGDILWPDWTVLKAKIITSIGTRERFYFNEAFLGLPTIGTMSRFAIDSLTKYQDVIRPVLAESAEIHKSNYTFAMNTDPFSGAIKSFLIASECACGMRNAFAPKIIQIGSGVTIQTICDESALPPLHANLPGYCNSKITALSCGCIGVGTKPLCYCPPERYCKALKTHGFEIARLGLLADDTKMEAASSEAKLAAFNDRTESRQFLAEDPVTYNQLDSCFANIFLCHKPISYQFWMLVQPTALFNGSSMVVRHASSWRSPWYMRVSYKGLPTGITESEHVMKISVEVRAPPHFTWTVDGCNTDLRVVPGRWHHVRVQWDRKTLALFIDDNLCGISDQKTLSVKVTSSQRFNTRRTPFVFIGDHTVQDFIFNSIGLVPAFFSSSQLANSRGEPGFTSIRTQNDFYAAFRFANAKTPASLHLLGVEATVLVIEEKLVVKSKQGQCSVFQLPVSCGTGDSCSVEVERQGSRTSAYSHNVQLSTVHDQSWCDLVRQRISQLSLVPNSLIQLFNRGRSELLQRRLIHTTHFPKLDCAFNHLRRHSIPLPPDLASMCQPSEAFPGILVESPDGSLRADVNGALTVSNNRLVFRPLATNAESICLRDLEMCQFGFTLSFWMLPLPFSSSPKIWPIIQVNGPSGSQMTVDLVRADGEYSLEAIVKRLQTIARGEGTSSVWRVKATADLARGFWTLVTISWSDVAGLTLKLNGTLGDMATKSYKESVDWSFPIEEGFWFGYRGPPDTSEGVVVDDFQFIPAELNYLASVGQTVDVSLSNRGLERCLPATCLDGSSCYPVSRSGIAAGEFCRCEHPWRLCKQASSMSTTTEVPIGPTGAITSPPLLRSSVANMHSSPTPTPTPPTPPSMASTTGEPITRPSFFPGPSSRANHYLNGRTKMIESHSLSPQSPMQRDTVFSTPQCNPPCQNGGKCVRWTINGEFECDCSETSFWGGACTREHVGWLLQDGNGSAINPYRKAFATLQLGNNNTKQRFIFRTPITEDSTIAKGKRFRKSLLEPHPTELMPLMIVKCETFVCGLVTAKDDLFLVIERPEKSLTRLIPCLPNSKLKMDNGIPHVVQVEHSGFSLRVKVDGIAVYPIGARPQFCDEWLYFSSFPQAHNRTHGDVMRNGSEATASPFASAFLGAWPDGEGEFKGAIGGWMVNKEEMIVPTRAEPEDTPNIVYRLNRPFSLSKARFHWIRLNSLSPVIVLVDDSVTKTPSNSSTMRWFWIIGCIILGLLLLLLICWVCIRLLCRGRTARTVVSPRNYASFKPVVKKTLSPAPRFSHAGTVVHPSRGNAGGLPTWANGNCVSPKMYQLKAHTVSREDASSSRMDNLWRARMLTLQPQPRSASIVGCSSPAATSMSSLSPLDETDDVEEILVTPDGESVITFATNRGTSIKQWSTCDGTCHREIVTRPENHFKTKVCGIVALHEKNGLLFADEQNNAQLYSLDSGLPSAEVQLPSTIWGAFPFGELVLFVTAPMTEATEDSFTSLYFWSPSSKALVFRSHLKIKSSWQSEGFLPKDSKRLQPILGPNQENLLLRWFSSSAEDHSFSITVNLSAVPKEVKVKTNPLITLELINSTFLVKHTMNLQKTAFLHEDIAVTGDTHGVLHIWNVHSGKIYRSVQSDPIPVDGPLLLNLAQYDFSQLTVDSNACPITALTATEPAPMETGSFTWFCSCDNSGCVVVRRCVTTANTTPKNVATRIHAKFRPYSRDRLTYSADTITCARLANRPRWRKNKPEAFLATGDSSGCIRVWLLPQCTQLAQLSASCESELLDLALTQPRFAEDLRNQWLQVVGLLRRDKSASSSYEHGRVVIIHLSANEENGVPNAMHSPRIRIVLKK